jgi:hypothetical protein
MRNLRFPYSLGLVLLLALVVGFVAPTLAERAGVQFAYGDNVSILLAVVASLIAAAISFFIYYQKEGILPLGAAIPLGIFRYLVMLVAALLLLEPKLETRNKQLQPPVVAILHDDSESILISRDSTFIRSEYPALLKAFTDKLNTDALKTHFFAFGPELGSDASPDSLSYRLAGTNISNALSGAAKLFSNQNLGAVVLLTDGISTSGINPLYALDALQQLPVYTVLLGDTTPQKDIRITEVLYNQIAYLDNETPVKVKVLSTGFETANLKVSISGQGKLLSTQNVTLTRDKSTADIDFMVKPGQTGIAQYTITVDPLPGELTTRNNSKAIFINVLETKVKIALFGGYPHPDIGVINKALDRDERYQLTEFVHKSPTTFYEDPAGYNLADYDLFILHNFPFSASDATWLEKIKAQIEARKVPIMVFVGQNTNLPTLKATLGDRMGIVPGTILNNVEEAMIVFKEEYKSNSTFTFDDQWIRMMNSAPPLYRNQSEWKGMGDTKIFGTARIKGVALDYPVYGLQNHLERKNMVFVGENIWRMRAHAYVETGAFDAWDTWLYNNIQWLIVREDKRRFKVSPSKQLYTGNESILFRGEAYDESYNPLTGVDIKVNLKYPNGTQEPIYLKETGNARYFGELNNLEEGTYSYEAEGTKGGARVGTDRGQFSVGKSNIEHFNLTADKGLLQQIALRTRGSFHTARELNQVADEILALNSLKPVATITIKRMGFNEYLWIFFVLLGLLAVEWVVRKRYSLS